MRDAAFLMAGVVVGVVVALVIAGWLIGREQAVVPPVPPPLPPPSPPAVDISAVVTPLIEANGRLMQEMMQRGLEAVVTSMERATYGPPRPPDEEKETVILAQTPSVDDPPWANWPEDGVVTEQSDRDIQDWQDSNADRGVVVSKLPDFTGERLNVGE